MNLDEARRTIWPFRDVFNGRDTKNKLMGELLDRGWIIERDLKYALEKAYDPKVRQAAKTLLLASVEQSSNAIPSSAGPLNVIASPYRSFAERRQLQIMLIQGIVLGIVFGATVMWFLIEIGKPTTPNQLAFRESFLRNPDAWWISLLLFIFALLIFAVIPLILTQMIIKSLDNQFDRYRQGQKGEESALYKFYQLLDGNWWLFRNIEVGGWRGGDFDFVLVGHAGIWLIEVKALTGKYRNMGDRWDYQLGRRWFPATRNPTRQVKRNAARLNQMLRTHNVIQWITPVILWVNSSTPLILEYPSAVIWQLDDLSNELNALPQNEVIPLDKLEQIVGALTKMCQQESNNVITK